jgi:hypothetical protein
MTKRDTASAAARDYLNHAADAIDDRFGEGFAEKTPELVAALVQASAIESAVLAGRTTSDDIIEAGRVATRDVCETMLKLKPRLLG